MLHSVDNRKARHIAGMMGRVWNMRRQAGSTPWNIPHARLLGCSRVRADMQFEKWHRRSSNPANALYWRMHPQEVWW